MGWAAARSRLSGPPDAGTENRTRPLSRGVGKRIVSGIEIALEGGRIMRRRVAVPRVAVPRMARYVA